MQIRVRAPQSQMVDEKSEKQQPGSQSFKIPVCPALVAQILVRKNNYFQKLEKSDAEKMPGEGEEEKKADSLKESKAEKSDIGDELDMDATNQKQMAI